MDLVGDCLPVIFLVMVLGPGVGMECTVNTRYFHISRHTKAPFYPIFDVCVEGVVRIPVVTLCLIWGNRAGRLPVSGSIVQ